MSPIIIYFILKSTVRFLWIVFSNENVSIAIWITFVIFTEVLRFCKIVTIIFPLPCFRNNEYRQLLYFKFNFVAAVISIYWNVIVCIAWLWDCSVILSCTFESICTVIRDTDSWQLIVITYKRRCSICCIPLIKSQPFWLIIYFCSIHFSEYFVVYFIQIRNFAVSISFMNLVV